MKIIQAFEGELRFLSNFAPCEIYYGGYTYLSVEAAFQAAKIDPQHPQASTLRKSFSSLSPREAKASGRRVPLNPEWEKIKDSIMLELCRLKFQANAAYRQRLLETGEAQLVEGNYWHDNIWGNCNCSRCAGITGENRLGRILMQIRKELAEQKFVAK